MNTYITNLFNDGANEGDLTIITKDGEFNCHSFILQYCTDLQIHDSTCLSFEDYNNKTMKFLFNYIYNQTLQDVELTPDDIITVFNLSEMLNCKDFINGLKTELATQFYNQLTKDNWIQYYDQLFGEEVYNQLNDVLMDYYSKCVLNDMTEVDDNFIYNYQTIKSVAVYNLLTTALKVLSEKNCKLQHMVEKETEDTENGDTENATEEDVETDEESDEEQETDTYSTTKIMELLKSDFSFKQIANMCKKDKETVINDFVKYVRKTDKGKSFSNVLTKYNIIYKNDKASLEKILLPQKKVVCM